MEFPSSFILGDGPSSKWKDIAVRLNSIFMALIGPRFWYSKDFGVMLLTVCKEKLKVPKALIGRRSDRKNETGGHVVVYLDLSKAEGDQHVPLGQSYPFVIISKDEMKKVKSYKICAHIEKGKKMVVSKCLHNKLVGNQ